MAFNATIRITLIFALLLFFLGNSMSLGSTRIMPLGDSITKGNSAGAVPDQEEYYLSYRKDLREKLVAAGYDIDFVGQERSGWEVFPDADHEGHPGFHANGRPDGNNILAYVYGYLALADPVDVVLLHIGTNDISQDGEDANEVSDILDEIDRYESDYGRTVWVILALIINRTCCTAASPCQECDDTTQFNDDVFNMAQARIAAGDKIRIVDMETGAGMDYRDQAEGGDMWDNIHPYETCFAKMADVWFAALDQILAGPSVPAVRGCVSLDGNPIPGRRVILKQPDEPNQRTKTDENSCYRFPSIVSGETFKVIIKGPPVPSGYTGGVRGGVHLKGNPVANRRVVLKQIGETTQRTKTDTNGRYQFPAVVRDKTFKVIIKGPVVP